MAAANGTGFPRFIEFTIVSIRHLPKTCNAYVSLDFLDHHCQTNVFKGLEIIDFQERFSVSVCDKDVGSCVFVIKDYNKFSSNQIVGSVALQADVMQRFCLAQLPFDSEHTFEVIAPNVGGLFKKATQKAIIGHDGKPCVLTVRIRVAALFDLREPILSNDGLTRRVEVTILSLRHLPKKDFMGSCDAFVELLFLGNQFKTRVQKKSYDPDFHETFGFSIHDTHRDIGPCEILVKDWDTMTASDDIGKVVLEASLIQRLVQAEIGWEGWGSFELVTGNNTPVVGHDGSACTLTISVRVAALLTCELAGMRCENLPTTAAYCKITAGPGLDTVARSKTVANTHNPCFAQWHCHNHSTDHVVIELSGTSKLEADPHSRLIPSLLVMEPNRMSKDNSLASPLLLPLEKLVGMWSTCAAKRTHLSLPLRLNNPPPERDHPPPAAPRSAELRPMLHLTLRTAPAAQEKTVEKKEETEKDRPATQLASKARPDAGHESSNRHAPTYHLVVYVRGARNLPLDKCESCSGFSQMLDLRAWRLDVRCQASDRSTKPCASTPLREAFQSTPTVPCESDVLFHGATPPPSLDPSHTDACPSHTDAYSSHTGISWDPPRTPASASKERGEAGLQAPSSAYWPLQLLSFPGEQRKEEEEEEERPEEAGSDGVVPGEEITIHLALMQVPKSGLTLSEISDAFGTTDAAVAALVMEERLVGSRTVALFPPPQLWGSPALAAAAPLALRQHKGVELMLPQLPAPASHPPPPHADSNGCTGASAAEPTAEPTARPTAVPPVAAAAGSIAAGAPSRLLVGADGQGPAVVDMFLVWCSSADGCNVSDWRGMRDVPLARPMPSPAWGALSGKRQRLRDKRVRDGNGRTLAPVCAPSSSEGSSSARSAPGAEAAARGEVAACLRRARRAASVSDGLADSGHRAPDPLTYVDAPVWRRGNGEVLVGRDVPPQVGMRVEMSRQAVRHRFQTACAFNTPDHTRAGSRRRQSVWLRPPIQSLLQCNLCQGAMGRLLLRRRLHLRRLLLLALLLRAGWARRPVPPLDASLAACSRHGDADGGGCDSHYHVCHVLTRTSLDQRVESCCA